uniref:Fumarate reductase flavoprotein subunit n=1 Tax=uncultured bacterium BLR7 TaxID=506523 RepID=C0INP0_9BACT|nr:fumarate reductase flavoprotein subunit [uncultured bacterium BLR7]
MARPSGRCRKRRTRRSDGSPGEGRMAEKKTVSRRDLIKTAGAAGAAVAAGGIVAAPASAQTAPNWDREADIVIIGSGATGMPAAIVAREAGSSVIIVDANKDIGGHAICSGANIPLGGGTSIQKKFGIKDSPDLVYQDLTDWSVVQPNGAPDYRYNDREIIRAFADNCTATFEFLLSHDVTFVNEKPDGRAGSSHGNSVPRQMHVWAGDWPQVQTGRPTDEAVRKSTSNGNGLMRPLEASARKLGVDILLEHRMTSIHREQPKGRVTGIAVTNNGRTLNIRAKKAVIVATGGFTGNVNFRRMFDPRLTEEYCGLAGMPWSNQDGSGEIASMAVGASLWGLTNFSSELGSGLTKAGKIGCQYGYVNLTWMPGSRVFDEAGASGLRVRDWQNVITVNMLGKRFYDETGEDFTGNQYNQINPYTPNNPVNIKNLKYNPNDYLNAAMAGIGDGQNGGGPIWAIFDADAAAREKWDTKHPWVDEKNGFFFSANSISELAAKIKMKYQRLPMPSANLEATVARYNSFVDSGTDEDFGKPKPMYKIAKGPFYAAWAMPVIHDTRAGLRINAKCQVMDMDGQVIPNFYCGGESAGGFSMHGLARCLTQGYIAGHAAHAEKAI